MTAKDLKITWPDSGGVRTNGRVHYLPHIREDQRENMERLLLRVFQMGKEARAAEIMELLR